VLLTHFFQAKKLYHKLNPEQEQKKSNQIGIEQRL
jgi:hypothetical protein